MQNLKYKLQQLANHNKAIQVYIIGLGFMGTSLLVQLESIDGIQCRIAGSRRKESVQNAFQEAGYESDKIIEFTAGSTLHTEYRYIATDIYEAIDIEEIDVIIDATGDAYEGAKIAQKAIASGKHLVSFNVETEAIVGPILKRKADEKGVVYTGIAGDEPGSVKELFDFAEFLGFEVLVIGKGKNNPLIHEADYESLREEAYRKGLNSHMLATFVDGSKTMIELTSMCNSTGFVPDISGCHGIESDLEHLAESLDLIENGGILQSFGVVEYVRGIAPGVFIIVKPKHDIIDHELKFLKVGKGPHYVLYRPYHLTSMEAPITIAQAYFEKIPTIAPKSIVPSADTIAVAKKDLFAGNQLDEPGGKSVYGTIVDYKTSRNKKYLPYGFVHPGVRMKMDVKKGTPLTYDMVDLPSSTLLDLRKELDKCVDEMERIV
ncbi:MAG: NAD(P)-dependent oxidoreductase [Tissierellia bacterium]|nr:NAD(P)-dependent oxidoreductase [Tissierellia bacterium]